MESTCSPNTRLNSNLMTDSCCRWETRASLSIPTTPSNCHSGQMVQLSGMSFFPVSPPLPDANEQGPCSFSFPCHLMPMEHKDDKTIMLFPLQDYATSSRKFFCK